MKHLLAACYIATYIRVSPFGGAPASGTTTAGIDVLCNERCELPTAEDRYWRKLPRICTGKSATSKQSAPRLLYRLLPIA